jgi:hypothetical protein
MEYSLLLRIRVLFHLFYLLYSQSWAHEHARRSYAVLHRDERALKELVHTLEHLVNRLGAEVRRHWHPLLRCLASPRLACVH